MALNDRQRRFIDEYLVDLNGAQAAVRSGYSPRSAKQRAEVLLKQPEVAAAIAEAQAARAERTGITQDMVLQELAKIGFSDIRNAVKWQSNVVGFVEDPETGEPRAATTNNVVLVDSADLTADAAACIAEVSQGKDGGLKIKLHDKRAALVDIGKHLGMFKERVEVTGKNGGPVETDATVRVEFVRPKKDADDPDA